MDVLEAIANRVSQAGNETTPIQTFQALSSKDLAGDGPRALLARRGLGLALDQLGRSRDHPGGQATHRASYPNVQRAVRLGEVLTDKGQGTIIGDEEQRIQCTVSEHRCRCSLRRPERSDKKPKVCFSLRGWNWSGVYHTSNKCSNRLEMTNNPSTR